MGDNYSERGRSNRGYRSRHGNVRNRFRNDHRNAPRGREQSQQVYRPPRTREVHFENQNNGGRVNQRRGGRRGNNNQQGPNMRDVSDPTLQWYKTTIPHGAKNSKDFIVRSINALVEKPITPYNYRIEGNAVIFFVQGDEIAEQLKALSRRISTTTGSKLVILVSRTNAAPQPQINDKLAGLIREVMSKRYDVNFKLLNLSNFKNDSAFVNEELFVALSRPNILVEVVKVIKANIPDLVLLDLSENNMTIIEPITNLAEVCKSLKGINLAKNKIKSLIELEHLKGMDLEEVSLSGNPFIDTFREHTAYISSVRKLFPKVVKLDGDVLPPPIVFDVGEEKSIVPSSLGNFMPAEVQQFVGNFLEQFYLIYDSNDRSALIAAYHDLAVFSFSIGSSGNEVKSAPFATELIKESRNLTRIQMSAREKLLKQGRINIIAFLGSLPSTEHKSESFHIDVPFSTNALIIIVVNGVYIDKPKKGSKTTRSFCRSFTIIPQGDGFVITNDQLMVANSSYDQRQKFKSSQPSQSSENTNVVDTFALRTGMTPGFAQQCLEENNYDINEAYKVFEQLNSRGLIPSDAFVR